MDGDLGGEDPLEEGMATHSSILAWRIPWMEEPGGLQSTVEKSQTRLSNFHFGTQGGSWRLRLDEAYFLQTRSRGGGGTESFCA